MLVNIRRSQDDGWVFTSYCLDAQIVPTPEELELIQKHGVGSLVIFDSENVEYYGNAAVESAKSIGYEDHTGEEFFNYITSFYTSLYHLGAAAYNALQWSFSLRLTVQSLIDGTHIESETAEEVIRAETLIAQAAEHLKNYLIELSQFDGSESYHDI